MDEQPDPRAVPSEWEHDLSDAAWADPNVTDAVKAAGCSVTEELHILGAQTS